MEGFPHIEIAVEIKNDWPKLIAQAAAYTCCLLAARETSLFALVIAFNHQTFEVRFCFFSPTRLVIHYCMRPTDSSHRQTLLYCSTTARHYGSALQLQMRSRRATRVYRITTTHPMAKGKEKEQPYDASSPITTRRLGTTSELSYPKPELLLSLVSQHL